MATGLEVAGLALSAFPVVVAASRTTRKGFKSVSELWRFKRTFGRLQDELDIQKTRYKSHLVLFCYKLGMQEKTEQIFRHVEDQIPIQESIKAEFNERSRALFKDSYSTYIHVSNLIIEQLRKLRKQLNFDRGQAPSPTSHLSIGEPADGALQHSIKNWDKVKFAWARTELRNSISEIKAHNDGLETLLNGAAQIRDLEMSHLMSKKGADILKMRNDMRLLYRYVFHFPIHELRPTE
ncbi:MAG: hypothetical protein Q9162_001101 [Coniocarpon cinnabarinum]